MTEEPYSVANHDHYLPESEQQNFVMVELKPERR